MTRHDAPALLLDGPAGAPGFVFHDSHNQPVHAAAPGLLGLLEARFVMARWKPQSLAWLDGTEHFFNHLFVELAGVDGFEAVRRELESVRALDAPAPVRNAFLFQYLGVLTRELERRALPLRPRPRSVDVPQTTAPFELPLDGPWRARLRVGQEWTTRDVDLPVNWELLPGIEDYAGTMRFTRVLPLPSVERSGPVSLRLAGVDYFADVWCNGHHVGGHEGYFAPFELDLSPYLLPGEDNILRVAVTSPNDPSGPGTHVTSGWHDFSPASAFPNRKTLVKGTLGHHDAKRGGAWSSVTSQDGNTGGLWGDMALRFARPLHVALLGVRVTTLSATSQPPSVAARIELTLRNAGPMAAACLVRTSVAPANFEGEAHEVRREVRLKPGANDVVLDANLAPVRLWNPRDHGFPHLYKVTVDIERDGEVHDRAVVETGFRALSVSPIGESTGPDGALVVNERVVAVRGTNLLPTYWLSEYSPERVERDFDMLEAAGVNAVLVHNLVAPAHFYRAANRRGFLVVQMFPLQWSYEQSFDLASRMTAQVHDLAALLYNEPSVVSYEIHNEPDMRTFEDLDNRLVDFDLHATMRAADPTRWATTFASGNHAYPGQFYPLRDDNSFATLPARFLEGEVHGRRISRHRNMPTEFGIQAMPNVELFRELVSEGRVRSVLERIREDPKWVAAGAESWAAASKAIDDAKQVLGAGSWSRALRGFDWSLLWEMGELGDRIRGLESAARPSPGSAAELASLRLALLLLDVLHYGAFKGENFWFGLWKPASSLEGLVRSGQKRQYRLHKDAIEHYLNATALGPITGFFSFMFRDADWEAPTWGVVDAAWVPKKAYRAYVESNQPVRVTLPQALRSPVKLPGDPWFATHPGDRDRGSDAPWAAAEVIVVNDTAEPLPETAVAVWLENAHGARLDLVDHRVTVDLAPGGSWTGPAGGDTVPDGLPAGTYVLRAELAAGGQVRSTNAYELFVPDLCERHLAALPPGQRAALLDGAGGEGFHYWHGGAVVHRAQPGLRGFLAGWHQVLAMGTDQYETVQGEHLFRHLLTELAAIPGAGPIREELWRIRAEVLSPAVKARALVHYVQLVVREAEALLAAGGRPPRRPLTLADRGRLAGAASPLPAFTAVGRGIKPARAPRSRNETLEVPRED